MKKHRFALLVMLAGFTALITTSCVVNPYQGYSQSSGGFGMGHGYGSPNFSSSVFVSTGNPRWVYDPYAGAYFDHSRSCYYDPHLCGYYPRGFRPAFVHGAPHPQGWSHGNSFCAPPSVIRSTTISISHSRSRQYRSLGNSWSRNIRDNDSNFGHHDRGQYAPQHFQQRAPQHFQNHRSQQMQQDSPQFFQNGSRREMQQQAQQDSSTFVSAPGTAFLNESQQSLPSEASPPPIQAPSISDSAPAVQSTESQPSPEPEASPIGLGETQEQP